MPYRILSAALTKASSCLIARLAKNKVMSDRSGNKHPTSSDKSKVVRFFTENAYAANAIYHTTLTSEHALTIFTCRLRFLKQKMAMKAMIVANVAITDMPQG